MSVSITRLSLAGTSWVAMIGVRRVSLGCASTSVIIESEEEDEDEDDADGEVDSAGGRCTGRL